MTEIDQLRSQIDRRSTDAGRKVSEHGSDLRAVGDQLRQQGNDRPAKLADQAAHHVERAGSWLTESDADQLLRDVEDAARKNPWAIMAGGLALGLAASRFLKASSQERYSARGRRELPRPSEPDEARFARDVPTSSSGGL